VPIQRTQDPDYLKKPVVNFPFKNYSSSRRSHRLQRIEPGEEERKPDYSPDKVDEAFVEVLNEALELLGVSKIKEDKLKKLVVKNNLNAKRALLTIKKNIGFYRNQLRDDWDGNELQKYKNREIMEN